MTVIMPEEAKRMGIRGLAIRLREEDIAHITVRKADFAKSYKKAEKTLDKRLNRFSKVQDEERVHDMRTAMRRIQAHVRLLPKGVRKGRKGEKFNKDRGTTNKRSAKIRDLDIIRAKVSTLPEDEARDSLLLEMLGRRQALIQGARKSARAFQKDPPPKLGRKVTEGRLQKRFRKVVDELAERINRRLPVVLEDETDAKGLHALRMDCKKLRYTLEIATENDVDATLESLRSWNDALGAVHDWDVVNSYMREKSPRSRALIALGKQRREQEYQKFLKRSLEIARTDPPVAVATIKRKGEKRGGERG